MAYLNERREQARLDHLQNNASKILQILFPQIHSDLLVVVLSYLSTEEHAILCRVCKPNSVVQTKPHSGTNLKHEMSLDSSWAITTPFYKRFNIFNNFELFSMLIDQIMINVKQVISSVTQLGVPFRCISKSDP
jgi:hypothetical protein